MVIEQAPHDIISPGMLERDGVCDWAGFFPDGARVVLQNHRFITMPRCDPGQATHTRCPGGHRVRWCFAREKEGCGRRIPRGGWWACPECDFDVCSACEEKVELALSAKRAKRGLPLAPVS